MKSCFLVGHHDAPISIQPLLDQIVEKLITQQDVSCFYVGCHGSFDAMAVSAIQKAIACRADVYAYLVIPYHPCERQYSVPEFFEDTYYPNGMEVVPRRYAIPRANRIVLDESDILVTFVSRQGGNAAKLLKHGRTLERKGYMKIYNLSEGEFSAE